VTLRLAGRRLKGGQQPSDYESFMSLSWISNKDSFGLRQQIDGLLGCRLCRAGLGDQHFREFLPSRAPHVAKSS
jgi:hypothetical protein